MRVTVIPIVVGALGTVSKSLEESWRPEETYCLSDSYERPAANAGMKNSERLKKKSIIHNRIASVGYVVIGTKSLIT